MAVTLNDLTSMSQAELDDLFRRSPMGDIPDGDAQGTAIVAPGSEVEGPVLWLARWLAWQGKVFDRSRGTLLNKVGPLGLHLIRASVYVAPSWFDNQPAIILDYSKTSLLARKVQRRAATAGVLDIGADEALQDLRACVEALAHAPDDQEARFGMLGAVLFAAVHLARTLRLDPELALRAAAQRFREAVEAGAG